MRLARSCCCSTAVCVVIFARLVQRTSYTYMDALFAQEVKSTWGESGRYWERIDVLAGSQDNQGRSRQRGPATGPRGPGGWFGPGPEAATARRPQWDARRPSR
jgi:hypothetical protein